MAESGPCGAPGRCGGTWRQGAPSSASVSLTQKRNPTTRTTLELEPAFCFMRMLAGPSGLTGFGPRIRFALTPALLARGPDGSFRPAYSRFAGTLGGIAVYSAWQGHPITTRHVALELTWAMSSSFQDALLTEFSPDLRRLSRRLTPARLRKF